MTLEEHALRVWKLDCRRYDLSYKHTQAKLDEASREFEHEIERASTSDLLMVFVDSRSRGDWVRGPLAREIDARIPRRRA